MSVEPTPVENRAQGAVGAGVAVGADDKVPGDDHTLFRQQGVLDAHRAHVEEILYAFGAREVPDLLTLLGGLDVLVRHEVVHDEYDLVLVIDAIAAGLIELVDGHRRRDVVAEHQVQVRHDDLAGCDGCFTAVGRQYFLCHCHAHILISFLLSLPRRGRWPTETSKKSLATNEGSCGAYEAPSSAGYAGSFPQGKP